MDSRPCLPSPFGARILAPGQMSPGLVLPGLVSYPDLCPTRTCVREKRCENGEERCDIGQILGAKSGKNRLWKKVQYWTWKVQDWAIKRCEIGSWKKRIKKVRDWAKKVRKWIRPVLRPAYSQLTSKTTNLRSRFIIHYFSSFLNSKYREFFLKLAF